MIPFFSTVTTIVSAIYFLVLGLAAGFPLTALFDDDVRSRLLVAPVAGLGLFGVLGAILFLVLPFSLPGVACVVLIATALAWTLGGGGSGPLFRTRDPVGALWVAVALALAFVPAFANAPHVVDGGIALGDTVFDHAKVSIVDEIARNGLPAHNPFYQEAGSANLLNYYYLWYLVAATAKPVVGANGWEADVALTGVTAFLSLTTLAWAAVAYGRRASAGWWVLAIACAGTLRYRIDLVPWLRDRLSDEHRLEGWIEQAPWVPQHLFAATLATLAILGLVTAFKARVWAPQSGVIVGIMIAAAYDSSIWIGGFALAAVLPLVALIGLAACPPATRRPTFLTLAVAVASALASVSVFLIRNLSIVGHRKAIAFWAYPVLAGHESAGARLANEFAYWLFLLVADFGFAYLLTVFWCLRLGRRWSAAKDLVDPALALAFVLPLVIAQLIVSVVANNDLGWRIVLVSVFAMTIIAAASSARLAASSTRVWIFGAALLFLGPAIVSGAYISLRFARAVQVVRPTASPYLFAQSSDLWQAVRAVTPKDQAILNNPNDLADMTLWPGNIGWALLSDRRSCMAGKQALRAYAPRLLPDDLKRLDERVDRVFSGHATAEDFRALKQDNLCSTLVVVPTDGLWASPLMSDNPYYTLVDSRMERWRLYR